MPYIIETHREGGWPHTTSMRDVISRRAVATLDEAREHTIASVRVLKLASADPGWSHGLVWAQVHSLPDHGGTVGPLPDGTVIEVERVTLSTLADRAGIPPTGQFPARTGAEIIDAWNEAQS